MSKGVSLHIGVNKLNPTCYPLAYYSGHESVVVVGKDQTKLNVDGNFFVAWEGTLGPPSMGCEKDASDLSAIAKKQGFRTKVLTTENATAKNVQKEIKKAAKRLTAGDIFFLTYAGHGSQVDDLTNDEAGDNEDETWCLYDRMFLDDEQRALYSQFDEGVRIVVFSDSCHSGTATRAGGHDMTKRYGPRGELQVRGLSRETAKAVYLARKDFYDDIQLGVKQPQPKLLASRILISACQDCEEAMGNDENGYFTYAVKQVWDGGKFTGTYEKFADAIKDELEEYYNVDLERVNGDKTKVKRQVPNFVSVAEKDSQATLEKFVRQKPFSIDPD